MKKKNDNAITTLSILIMIKSHCGLNFKKTNPNRALEVYKVSGKTMSSFLQQQHQLTSEYTGENHETKETEKRNRLNTKDNKTPSDVIEDKTRKSFETCKDADDGENEVLSEEEKNEREQTNDG